MIRLAAYMLILMAMATASKQIQWGVSLQVVALSQVIGAAALLYLILTDDKVI